MTADTITAARISDIEVTLETALETVRRLLNSEPSSDDSAILTETLANIQSAFR